MAGRREDAIQIDGDCVISCAEDTPRVGEIQKADDEDRSRDQPLALESLSQNNSLGGGKCNNLVKLKSKKQLVEDELPNEVKVEQKPLLWRLVEWACLFIITVAFILSFMVPRMRISVWGIHSWKWILIAFAILCGRLVATLMVKISVSIFEKHCLFRSRVLYFVYGLRNAVESCFWVGLVLLTWSMFFDKEVEDRTKSQVPHFITKSLIACVVGTLLWLTKTLFVKILATFTLSNAYFYRMQKSLFNQYLIQTFQSPRTSHGRIVIGSGGRLGKCSNVPEITVDDLRRWNAENVSAWNLKRLKHAVKFFRLDEHIKSNNTGEDVATKLFNNVAKPGSACIYLEDLKRVMKDDEALQAMSLLQNGPGSGEIDQAAFKKWVDNACSERCALARTLKDAKSFMSRFNNMLSLVTALLIVLTTLIILGIATHQLIIFVFSQFLILSFAFGDEPKKFFAGFVFIFLYHPYDVGDTVEMDGDVRKMKVDEIHILTTVFDIDGRKLAYSNSTLETKGIFNNNR